MKKDLTGFFAGSRVLTNASGFFFRRGDRLFVVSNRHVLADAENSHFPDCIEIGGHTHTQDLTQHAVVSLPLYRDGLGQWREATDSGGAVDVAALEIPPGCLPADAMLRAFDETHLEASEEDIAIGDPLTIAGFPLGFQDTIHHLAVARSASIASAYGVRFQRQGCFLTDARTHRGSSGTPVVRRRTQDSPAAPTPSWQLLGVHSTRMDMRTLPVQCYTNGSPPQSALDAMKYRLPSTRGVNVNSIKAHLTTKKTGVGVGMTFFYQSWNHRRSQLPVDSELWKKGIVTYPNARDKEVSLEKRAGHAIEIIGWDDDMEVVMRDAEGKPVLDASGNPKKEKGFWLLKNSWGTASFGIEHPFGAGYGWLSMQYVKEYGSATIAELPSLAPAAEVCDDAAMVDEDGDGKANCADTDCAMHRSCSSSGGTAHTYSATPNASIPDDSPTGVSNTINVTDTGTITDVKVTTDISPPYRGDLKVTITHGTTSPVIFNQTGGSADDLKQTFTVAGFSGELSGAWTSL